MNKNRNWDITFSLTLTAIFMSWGIYMMFNGKYGVGVDGFTQQYTATGGELFLLVGLIFLLTTYYSLSPYSKIRNFFNSRKRKPPSK